MSRNGSHHERLRRMSAKVLDGAKKVSDTRCAAVSGGCASKASDVATGTTGGTVDMGVRPWVMAGCGDCRPRWFPFDQDIYKVAGKKNPGLNRENEQWDPIDLWVLLNAETPPAVTNRVGLVEFGTWVSKTG